MANLNIATGRALADGTPEVVPLRSVATIERSFNPENIRRQDLQRRIALFANVEGPPAGGLPPRWLSSNKIFLVSRLAECRGRGIAARGAFGELRGHHVDELVDAILREPVERH